MSSANNTSATRLTPINTPVVRGAKLKGNQLPKNTNPTGPAELRQTRKARPELKKYEMKEVLMTGTWRARLIRDKTSPTVPPRHNRAPAVRLRTNGGTSHGKMLAIGT